MEPTAHQYRTLLDLERDMVYAGWHPAVAGKLLLRASERVLRAKESGMGKIQPTRRLQRDLIPGIAPRPVVAGEQCRRIQEIPGDETPLYEEVNRLEQLGWNVMETGPSRGFPGGRVFYACPPGRLPMEAQPEILRSEPWGGPLYVKERF